MRSPGPCEDGAPHRLTTSWHGRPYHFFGDYLLERFGTRVLKLPIDAHLTCPNRDGTLSADGCVFCCEGSAAPSAVGIQSIRRQMDAAKESFRRADVRTRYIAYLQAYTNTYAPVPRLRELYDAAIDDPEVVGLMIGTRPDCLPDEVLDLITDYRQDGFELWIELGVQTVHDRSLAFMNRHHSHASSHHAIERIAARGIPQCLHVILGIPGETWTDMMRTATSIAALPVQGVKIHHLHVISGTPLHAAYARGEIPLLTLRDYVSTVCDFLERLRGDILVHRLMGDREEHTLIAPAWGLHKGTVLRDIEEMFSRRGTHQGFLLKR